MIKRCLGCGVILQYTDQNKEGYINDIEKDVCERCFRLKYYGEYKEVSIGNETYKSILSNIPKDALVVYLVSLLNINFDYIKEFKNVIVVLTKRDLLPKSVKDNKLIDYISKIVNNYLDIEIISSKKNYNLDNLLSKIQKHSHNKEIYFVGMTNSGKSTLINKLIENYSPQEQEVTTSMYPSTTLNKLEINLNGMKIIDTPGLLSKGSILNSLDLKEVKKVTPKKEIKPRSYQLKGQGSLMIENYVRIDYYTDNNIAIYLSNDLNITKMTHNNPRLKDSNKHSFNLGNDKDIVIEDLCFIKFTKSCKIDIYTSLDVNIYERNNLI